MADGNCGFRCVADAMHNDQERWDAVRRAISNELIANHDLYEPIYGEGLLMEAFNRIVWEGGACNEDHYMEIAADLFPIATHYRCAIMCFAMNPVNLDPSFSVTVLPLITGGRNSQPVMELAIAHLGRYRHFIRLHLQNGFPVPPISPLWHLYCDATVRNWDAAYAIRRARWDALIQSRT